jgi:hypothetical protein
VLTYAHFFLLLQVQLRVDELAAHAHSTQLEGEGKEAGSQFTCFTGTNVQILTQVVAEIAAAHSDLEVCAQEIVRLRELYHSEKIENMRLTLELQVRSLLLRY